mmetsp:Transcript_66230/g.147848  ORF Transcript_66230/g.147848 Transcript_66230/m.147848 type:complete len:249 (+) Transcript_66230:768-1514(+)
MPRGAQLVGQLGAARAERPVDQGKGGSGVEAQRRQFDEGEVRLLCLRQFGKTAQRPLRSVGVARDCRGAVVARLYRVLGRGFGNQHIVQVVDVLYNLDRVLVGERLAHLHKQRLALAQLDLLFLGRRRLVLVLIHRKSEGLAQSLWFQLGTLQMGKAIRRQVPALPQQLRVDQHEPELEGKGKHLLLEELLSRRRLVTVHLDAHPMEHFQRRDRTYEAVSDFPRDRQLTQQVEHARSDDLFWQLDRQI